MMMHWLSHDRFCIIVLIFRWNWSGCFVRMWAKVMNTVQSDLFVFHLWLMVVWWVFRNAWENQAVTQAAGSRIQVSLFVTCWQIQSKACSTTKEECSLSVQEEICRRFKLNQIMHTIFQVSECFAEVWMLRSWMACHFWPYNCRGICMTSAVHWVWISSIVASLDLFSFISNFFHFNSIWQEVFNDDDVFLMLLCSVEPFYFILK